MEPNPFLGIVFHWIGGCSAATTFIPFRRIRGWAWEACWLVQGIAAWIVTPLLLMLLLVPHAVSVLRAAPSSSLGFACLWGALWGIGGLTFGLAIRYLGIALGHAIALGLSTVFGTLIPPVYDGQIHGILRERSGRMILAGVVVCVLAVAVNGVAGFSKEHETNPGARTQTGEKEYSFLKGLGVAVLAGIMSSFFAFGLKAGEPIAALAKARLAASGGADLWQNLPVLVVVLWGGFVTNLIWTAVLLVRHQTFRQYAGAVGVNPMSAVPIDEVGAEGRLTTGRLMRNYVFAASAGIIWYFQFFFYSMGQTRMGRYDFSSWALHMASIIIFATLWGLVLREWRGTSMRTRLLVSLGLLLLITSTLIIGYGNYLKSTGG